MPITETIAEETKKEKSKPKVSFSPLKLLMIRKYKATKQRMFRARRFHTTVLPIKITYTKEVVWARLQRSVDPHPETNVEIAYA